MLKIIFENTAYLQKITKSKNKEVNLDFNKIKFPTINEALKVFSVKYGEASEQFFSKDGKIRRSIFVFLNNVLVPWSKLYTTKLKESDKISIIPAVAGG